MKYQSILIGILSAISVLLPGQRQATGADLHEQRMSRWREQSIVQPIVPEQADAGFVPLARSTQSLFSDLKINSDNSSSTFNQRFSDVAHFLDGRGAAVWEDERNGVWRIVVQPLSVSGLPVGNNRFLDNANPPVSLRQPKIAANNVGIVAIIYVNENDNGLYARTYDFSFSGGGNETRIDDAAPAHLVNQPDIAVLGGGKFVVVWEDTRSGSNIFAQILNSDGSRSGTNFRINPDVASPYRIAPAVSSSLGGDFVVTWEDGRSGNGDVYLRMFTEVGTPLFPELQLDESFASDYQFMPKLEYLKGTGYLATWISNRDGGQSVYGQIISNSSAPIGSTFRINDAETDICWDLNIESSNDSGAVCIWAEYSSTGAIQVQKIAKTGATVGINTNLENAGVLRERSFPNLAHNAAGYTAVWMDQRNGNSDIYAQRLTTALAKTNNNYKLNDDVGGSQQTTPDVTGITPGVVALTWSDRKVDQGDITMQLLTAAGTFFGGNVRVNDDVGLAIQKNPRISSSAGGLIWSVWEDARTSDGLQGQNIMTQRFDGSGNRQGTNVVVNSDATSRPKSNPDLDVNGSGTVEIVWVDERDNTKQIYVQGYSATGADLGGDIRVSDLPVGTQNLEPHVGVRNDGSFVVAWLAIVGSKQVGLFQRFVNGLPSGSPQMLPIDSMFVDVLDLDVCAHRSNGRFFVSTIERENNVIEVKMYAYDFSGTLLNTPTTVSDLSGNYGDVRISTDVSDELAIVWTGSGLAGKRSYFQILRDDGFAMGSNQLVSSSGLNRVEATPSATMIGGYCYVAWADCRNANAGFDIYLNSAQYTLTDVDDDPTVLPAEFSLGQNYPNPFNPETVIGYSLERPAQVRLSIYNILGQEVGRLVDDFQPAGQYEARWDASRYGFSAPSGVYLYRLTVGNKSVSKKMTLLK